MPNPEVWDALMVSTMVSTLEHQQKCLTNRVQQMKPLVLMERKRWVCGPHPGIQGGATEHGVLGLQVIDSPVLRAVVFFFPH